MTSRDSAIVSNEPGVPVVEVAAEVLKEKQRWRAGVDGAERG
jgi:hypothetical protein